MMGDDVGDGVSSCSTNPRPGSRLTVSPQSVAARMRRGRDFVPKPVVRHKRWDIVPPVAIGFRRLRKRLGGEAMILSAGRSKDAVGRCRPYGALPQGQQRPRSNKPGPVLCGSGTRSLPVRPRRRRPAPCPNPPRDAPSAPRAGEVGRVCWNEGGDKLVSLPARGGGARQRDEATSAEFDDGRMTLAETRACRRLSTTLARGSSPCYGGAVATRSPSPRPATYRT